MLDRSLLPRTILTIASLLILTLASSPALAQQYFVIEAPLQAKVGTTIDLRYHTLGFTGTFTFEYSTDSLVWKPVAAVAGAEGTSQLLPWTVPDDTSSRARLRVLVDGEVQTTSPPFPIVDRYRPRLQLAQIPDPLLVGASVSVGWFLGFAEDFDGAIVIEFSPDAGATWQRIDSVMPRSSFDSVAWRVPDDTTSRGQLRVRTSDGSAADTSSPTLKIRQHPALRLLQPNGGEVFGLDSLVWVRWYSVSIRGYLTIEYSPDGEFWQTVESRRGIVEGVDSAAWFVPAPPSAAGRIRITHDDGTLVDESDAVFRVVDGTSSAPWERGLPLRLDLSEVVPSEE